MEAEAVLGQSCTESWVHQFNAGLRELGCEGNCICRNNAEGCSPQVLEVKWRGKFKDRWLEFDVDPRAEDVNKRRHVAYKCWFKQEDDTQFKHLPWYMKAGFALSSHVVGSMARFRLGSHNLQCVRGAMEGIPYMSRICRRCEACGDGSRTVDDEHHVLFECAATKELRSNMDCCWNSKFPPGMSVRDFMRVYDSKLVARYVHGCMVKVDSCLITGGDPVAEQPQG